MTFTQQSILLAAASWRFETPSVLLALVALPFIAVLLWIAFLRRRNALKMFEGMTPQDSRPTAPRAGTKIALITIGLAMLTIAAARPQADPIEENVTVRGRDIVFLVDVSKSMLSRDAVPSRLGRAKLWINDLVNTLKGDRVGLVAFAGVPVVKCPLTLDLGYFRMALDELSPASVPRGGTLIGDAIRKTLSDVFEPGEGRFRDIVLITDGEDLGSFPTEAAKKAAEMGVRIIVIGIGSELEGALVPEEEDNSQRYIERDGKKVRSRMDGSTLAAIAEAATQAGAANGGGVFLNVGTGTMDLDKVYHDLIASAEQRETETKSNVTYRELFPYFLGLAALCFAIEPLIAGRSLVRRSSRQTKIPGAALAATVLFLAFTNSPLAHSAQSPAPTPSPATAPPSQAKEEANPTPTPPPSPDALYNSGRDLFLAGKYSQAADQFRQSDLGANDPNLSAKARFNLGQSLLKQATAAPQAGAQPDPAKSIEQLDAAARAFRSALAANPDDAEAARNVEIARTLMQQKQEEKEKKKQEQKDKEQKDKSKQDQSKQDQNDQKKDGQNQSGDKSQSNDQNSQGGESKQHQDNADKLKDLAQKQSEAADKSKEASESKESPESPQKQQQAKDAQKEVDQRTQDEQTKQQEAGKPSSQEAKDKLDSARKEQQAASEALDKGDTQKAEEHQRKAADQLDQAAQAEQKAADEAKKQEQSKEDQAKQNQQGKQAEAKEEKAKYNDTASQLLDRERKQRDARQQMLRALRGKPQPVEKDW